MRAFFAEFIHAHSLQGFVHPAADLRRRDAEVFRTEGHVVFHHGRDQLVVRILEHHAAAAPDLPGILRVCRRHAAHQHFSGGRQEQGVQMLCQRGFAGAVAADDGDETALFDVQGHPVQRHALLRVLYVDIAAGAYPAFRIFHVVGKRNVFQLYDRFFAHNQHSIS